MMLRVALLSLIFACSSESRAASLLLDSKDSATLVTTGSQATFGAQSFRLSVAGLGTNDTVASYGTLPATATLQTITFVRAPLGTATTGALYVKLYSTGADATGTPVAVSTNSIDVNAATSLSDLAFQFANPALSTSITYYAVFSTNGNADATGTDGIGARIAAANFGGGFSGTGAPGTVYGGSDTTLRGWNASNPPVAQNLDARFSVAFTVPEPGISLISSLGLLMILKRRR